jgi:hypothetical protein
MKYSFGIAWLSRISHFLQVGIEKAEMGLKMLFNSWLSDKSLNQSVYNGCTACEMPLNHYWEFCGHVKTCERVLESISEASTAWDDEMENCMILFRTRDGNI